MTVTLVLSMSKAAKSNSKVLSTWTPLNNEEANKKVYLERKELFCKWFEKWSEPQRKRIIADVLRMSSLSQLHYTDKLITEKLPTKERDFTRVLPRVLTLYLFSFLDPRTLCRCSQVCWYWKYLAELDQLWMLKCLRLGWNLPFSPGPYEHGLWKRNYVENLKSLQYLKTQMDLMPKRVETPPLSEGVSEIYLPDDHMRNLALGSARSYRSMLSQHSRQGYSSNSKKPSGPVKPAWRGSDPTPKDTWRYNYLNNDDDVEIVKALRAHGLSGPKSASIAAKAKSKTKSGQHSLNTRSRSLNFDSETIPGTARSTTSQKLNSEESIEDKIYGGRPDWAKPSSNGLSDRKSGVKQGCGDNSQKTNKYFLTKVEAPDNSRTPVSGAFEVFTQKPWKIPEQVDSD